MTNTRAYTLFGVAFGMAFPLLSVLIEGLVVQGLPLSWEMVAEVHRRTPLLYVIDSAPFFLGLSFGIADRYLDQAQHTYKEGISVDSSLRVMRRLRIVYILVLLFIAFTLSIGLLILQSYQKEQTDGGALIATAGRQRLLTQKLSKEMLLYTYHDTASDQQNLQKSVQRFAANGTLLLKDIEAVPDLIELRDSLVWYQGRINERASSFVEARDAQQKSVILNDFLKIESSFFSFINQLVYREVVWLDVSLSRSRTMAYIAFGIILLSLLVSGFAIFRPTINRAEQAIMGYVLANQKQEQANEELQQYIERLAETKTTLQHQKEILERTLDELKATQDQVLLSEKLAMMGKLLASVAHEINTPLGAIRSSVQNISGSISKSIQGIPKVMQFLDEREKNLFFELLDTAIEKKEIYQSSREERQRRKKVKADLEAQAIKAADTLARHIAVMGIPADKMDRFMPLLWHDESEDILAMAADLYHQHKSLITIEIAIEKAAKIVLALKSYARRDQSEAKTVVSITDNLDTILTLYHGKIKHTVEVQRNYQQVPDLRCYADELNQVWTNLINNALQAMQYKGTLTLSAQTKGDAIEIAISDTGTGIPPEVQDKIFEPFFTTKPTGEGSGLGLDIVKQIIEKHQGQIWFETEINKGTTFFVKLPFHD
ncbi:MAG: ATP-binding protein [Bernardetiaceae bacterium]